MPELAQNCIASWHKYMPDYQYILWNEANFDINFNSYVRESYDAGKYAFVSDVVRLYALERYGGIYFDVDFEVYRSFDSLLGYHAFAGFEGSKHSPVMMGVIASEAKGEWVSEQLREYECRHFIVDGKMDLTTNVKFVTEGMKAKGFIPNGIEQDYHDLHVFPVEYFCPRLTTGEYIKTDNTYCEHKGRHSSWANQTFKERLLQAFGPKTRTQLIKMKRKLIG